MSDAQEQVRQAMRDAGQELGRAMEQASRLMRQAAQDFSALVVPQRPPRRGESPVEVIRQLAALREEGLITEQEFQAKKDDLLARL